MLVLTVLAVVAFAVDADAARKPTPREGADRDLRGRNADRERPLCLEACRRVDSPAGFALCV
jgi:hypothetical protein